MAEPIPFKLYYLPNNQGITLGNPVGNTTGYQEADFAGAIQTGLSALQKYKSQYENPTANMGPANIAAAREAFNQYGGQSALDFLSAYQAGTPLTQEQANLFSQSLGGNISGQQLMSFATGQPVSSGTVQGPVTAENTAGLYTPESLQQYYAGTLNAPLQVPAGSPGAALQPFMGQNVTQGATPGSIVPNASVGAVPQSVGGQPGYIPQGMGGQQTYTPGGAGGGLTPQGGISAPQGGAGQTPPQPTNGYGRYVKDNQGNVYDMQTGQHITQDQFQQLGLNIGHLNVASASQLSAIQGGMTTGQLPSEQNDFFKGIQERYAQLDEMIARLLSAGEKSQQEKDLEKTAGDLVSSYEAGLTDINGQIIPMSLIFSQSQQLQRQANDKLNAINRTLERLEGNREAQIKVLEKAYSLSRQSIQDAVSFWQLTQPEKIGFDSKTGMVFMQNPMTGEIYARNISGFVSSSIISNPTEADKKSYEINMIEDNLIASKQGGDYVDGNVYLEQRRTSRLNVAEFDKRFGELLSPGDQQKYGISSSAGLDTIDFNSF